MRAAPGTGPRYAYKRARYLANRERIKAQVLAYYYANHERCKARQRELQRERRRVDPAVRAKDRERARLSYRRRLAWYTVRNSKLAKDWRQKARMLLNHAVQKGRVQRPAACEACRVIGPVQGHHHRGYKRPLDVLWLCKLCHGQAHWK